MGKKIDKLKSFVYVILAIFVSTFLVALPILCSVYSIGISSAFDNKAVVFGLVFGAIFGIAFGLIFGYSSGFVFGSIFGIGSGLVFGLVFGLDSGINFGLVFGLIFGLFVGLEAGLVFGFIIGIISGFLLGFFVGNEFGLISGIGFVISYFIGFYSLRNLITLLEKFSETITQTFYGFIHPDRSKKRSIELAIVSFVIFYIFTILIFSLWYYVLYLDNYPFFKIAEGIKLIWLHFVYFSVFTMATIGYRDITPIATISQALVVTEILLGLGLVGFYMITIYQIASSKRKEDKQR